MDQGAIRTRQVGANVTLKKHNMHTWKLILNCYLFERLKNIESSLCTCVVCICHHWFSLGRRIGSWLGKQSLLLWTTPLITVIAHPPAHRPAGSSLLCAELFRDLDVVTGTPPYFDPGQLAHPACRESAGCLFELRGGVEEYCEAASLCLRRPRLSPVPVVQHDSFMSTDNGVEQTNAATSAATAAAAATATAVTATAAAAATHSHPMISPTSCSSRSGIEIENSSSNSSAGFASVREQQVGNSDADKSGSSGDSTSNSSSSSSSSSSSGSSNPNASTPSVFIMCNTALASTRVYRACHRFGLSIVRRWGN